MTYVVCLKFRVSFRFSTLNFRVFFQFSAFTDLIFSHLFFKVPQIRFILCRPFYYIVPDRQSIFYALFNFIQFGLLFVHSHSILFTIYSIQRYI